MNAFHMATLAGVALLAFSDSSNPSYSQTSVAPTNSASVRALEDSRDRATLEQAAVALASSGDPDAVAKLGEFLRRAEFLARLDDLHSPADKTRSLQKVLLALADHPSVATERLCLMLAGDPVFLADDDRKIYLLPALAAVRPMSQEAVEVFRRTNGEGYYNLNVRLLVKNGSLRALALFEEMIRNDEVPAARRVDALHAAVLPYRTELATLQAVDRLLAGNLNDAVRVGAVETIFEHRSREWFGPKKNPPEPQPWESASSDALQFVLALAEKVRARGALPPPLLESVHQTVTLIREILAARKG